jgi:hypothetical protein
VAELIRLREGWNKEIENAERIAVENVRLREENEVFSSLGVAGTELARLHRIEKAASDFEREFGGVPEEDLMSVVGVTNSNVLLRKWRTLRNALQPTQTEKEN